MAWTAPRTWVTGEVVTAAMLNQQIRDNELFLYDPPCVRAWRTTNQSLTDSTWTAIAGDSEYFDNDTMHSTSVNTHRLTCNTAARFYLYGCVEFATNSTGNRLMRLILNDTTILAMVSLPPQATVAGRLIAFTEYPLAAGQWVSMECYQASGGALNAVSAAGYSPIWGARRVGAYS